jgi:hypothetical protein
MLGPYTRDTIENWVGEFLQSDAGAGFETEFPEAAPALLAEFLSAACGVRGVEPGEIEEQDLRTALLDHVARMKLSEALRSDTPRLCGALLGWLEDSGRLAEGRILGAYVGALREAFEVAASGKPRPITRPGSRIGRNDPCPCGSGRKYKKCCQQE